MSCLPPMTGNGLYPYQNGDWGMVQMAFVTHILRFLGHAPGNVKLGHLHKAPLYSR